MTVKEWIPVWTEHTSVIWSCIRIKGEFLCELNCAFQGISSVVALCLCVRRFIYVPHFVLFFCIRVTSGPRVKLAGRKSALNTSVVYSTDRSKAIVLVLFLLFVALWFLLRGDLFYVLPLVILFLCFSVLLALR